MDRYARNKRTITEQEQQVLAEKKVLVIGSGGLGSHMLEGLSRIGLTKIGICDYDIIEESNLNRQLLALEETIGYNKAFLAKERANKINKNIIVKPYTEKYPSQEILDDMKQYDLVIDCLDNIEIRKQLEKDCLANNVPLIYATIAGYYGYIGVIDHNNQLMKNQELRGQSIEKILGNPYFTVACVAAMQLKLAIDVLLNKDYLTNGFIVIDLQDFSIEKVILN